MKIHLKLAGHYCLYLSYGIVWDLVRFITTVTSDRGRSD